MPDTGITTGSDPTDLVRQVDILFNSKDGRHLSVSPVQRVDAFFHIIGQIATAEIETEIENEGHEPKPAVIVGRIAQRELQHVEEWKAMLDAAYMRKAQELGDLQWLNGDGQWIELADKLIDAIPEEQQRARSGRARQVARFIEVDVPTMKEVGVSPALIEGAYREDKPSLLSDVSQAAHIVHNRHHLEPEVAKREYEWILSEAAVTPTLRDFKASVRKRYRPDEPPPARILYTKETGQVGDRVRVAMDMDAKMWGILWNRVWDKLQEAPGSLFVSPSPTLVQQALGLNQVYQDTGEHVVWDAVGQQLMRRAITANWARATCLDALEKNAGRWLTVRDIVSVSDVSPIAVKQAMGELCVYVRDGWNEWAVRDEEGNEQWKLNNRT